jgi:predicted DCC family thiol-disulfide oxidoreductase YuxK
MACADLKDANQSSAKDVITIVYDGDCLFCSRSMAWIARHDRARRIRYTACTSETGSRLMRQHGIDPSDPSTFLVLKGGKAYVQSEAMLQLATALDPIARPFAALRLVPRPIRDFVYGWTARNRRRLLRSRECPVPTVAMRERMLP